MAVLTPPEWMVADCTPPGQRTIKSNADLVRRVDDWADAFDVCNAGRAALRDWAAEAAKEAQ